LQRKRKGHGRLGRVETDLLARTLPSETKEHAKTHTGETPNTVILDYYDGCLTDSSACLAVARSHRKLWSRFRFDRSLLAPPATTLGLGFPNMPAHLREYACSCPRGKISGPGLFAWI